MAMVMKDIQMAKSLYEQGATWKEISKELGEDEATIWYYMRKSGVHFDRKIPPIAREEVDKIAYLYRKGMKVKEIAKEVGRHRKTVARVLKSHGLKRTTPIESITVKMLEGEELGYLAGLFDGEGCIEFVVDKRRKEVKEVCRVKISNTNPEVINWLVEKVGGHVNVSRPKDRNHSTLYDFKINRYKDIVVFLRSILHLLKAKREKAQEAIRFCESRLTISQQTSGGSAPQA
jgi:predicted transcriptional regulator